MHYYSQTAVQLTVALRAWWLYRTARTCGTAIWSWLYSWSHATSACRPTPGPRTTVCGGRLYTKAAAALLPGLGPVEFCERVDRGWMGGWMGGGVNGGMGSAVRPKRPGAARVLVGVRQ